MNWDDEDDELGAMPHVLEFATEGEYWIAMRKWLMHYLGYDAIETTQHVTAFRRREACDIPELRDADRQARLP